MGDHFGRNTRQVEAFFDSKHGGAIADLLRRVSMMTNEQTAMLKQVPAVDIFHEAHEAARTIAGTSAEGHRIATVRLATYAAIDQAIPKQLRWQHETAHGLRTLAFNAASALIARQAARTYKTTFPAEHFTALWEPWEHLTGQTALQP